MRDFLNGAGNRDRTGISAMARPHNDHYTIPAVHSDIEHILNRNLSRKGVFIAVQVKTKLAYLRSMLRATFETGVRMLSRASLGHMHKRLSHGLAEVREESYYGLGTRTTCESTINPKSKKGTTLKFNRPYMVRRVRQPDLLSDRCNSNRGR